MIDMRHVDMRDADFIVKIRNDETKKKYVHAVPNDIDLQKEWIKKQHNSSGDYYFVVFDKQGHRIGLTSIYNVDVIAKVAEFGRWVSWGNAAQNVESVLLTFDFAFQSFDIDTIYMRTMLDNKKVRSFWKRFGAISNGKYFDNEYELWIDKSIITKINYFTVIRQKNIDIIDYLNN